MDARDQALALFVDALGIDEDDLRRFDGRKTFQKAMYLLQEEPFCLDLGFRYNLYIRGPYSPQLADAGYRLLGNPPARQAVLDSKQLVSTSRQAIDRLRGEFTGQDGHLDGDLLELAATHHFLTHQTYRYVDDPDQKRENSKQWIAEHKPELMSKLVEAVSRLGRLGMID